MSERRHDGPATPRASVPAVPAEPGQSRAVPVGLARKLPPGSVPALQRSFGNRVLVGLLGHGRPPAGVQRAIGLEIEVPIPADQLTGPEVLAIEADVAAAQAFVAAPAADDAARKKNLAAAEAKYMKAFGGTKKLGHKAVLRAEDADFAVVADHDDRVMDHRGRTRELFGPPREGGRDGLMEIVTKPALNAAELRQRIAAVRTFVDAVEQKTTGLTKRAQGPLVGGVSAGPLIYPGENYKRSPTYNWKASIHVNIGIDPREYHSLIKWYAKSDYAKEKRAKQAAQKPGDAAVHQKSFRQTREQLLAAVKIGKQATAFAKELGYDDEPLDAADLAASGNLRGLRGWLTHVALYLLRGTLVGAGSSEKNLAPVLLKTPAAVFTTYGFTPIERKIWREVGRPLIEDILKRVGRKEDLRKVAEDEKDWEQIQVFPSLGENGPTLERLMDIGRKDVMLTGGPLKLPTGVGPTRTAPGPAALPDVPRWVRDRVNGAFTKDDAGKWITNKKGKKIKVVPVIGQGRGGVVAEFRLIPGYFDGPAQWLALGLAFLAAAEARNNRTGALPRAK